MAPHYFIADAIRQFADPRLERRAPLGRRKRAGLDLARPDHIGEPARGGNHLLDRTAPTGAREIVGILAFGQQCKPKTLSRLEMRQRQVSRAPGGLLAGLVAVKTKN